MQNKPKAYRRLNVAAYDRTGFRDPNMKRIIRLLSQKLVGFHTHQHIRRLNADDHIFIAQPFNHMHLMKGAFYNSPGGNSVIFLHQFFFKGTAVYAYTNRNISLPGGIYYCCHLILSANIAGIDPDLVGAVFYGCNSHLIIKMNICYQGNGNLLFDLSDCPGCFHGGNRTSDNLTACFFQPVYLLHSTFYILCPCIRHRLYQNRAAAPNHFVTDMYFSCMLSCHRQSSACFPSNMNIICHKSGNINLNLPVL